MFASMARKMSSFFIANDVIKEEEQEIYNYSLEILLSAAINFGFIIIAAIIMNRITETAFYLVGFLPLRRSAGGYHAKTHFRCFCVLLVSYSLFLLIIKLADIQTINYIIFIILLINMWIIFYLSPIEDKNRPVSEEENEVFQKKSRIIIFFLSVATLFLFYFSQSLALCLSLGISAVSVSLILSKLSNLIIEIQ